MAGLVPAIHVFSDGKDVDARNKCGHDERECKKAGHLPGHSRFPIIAA
jgi:hypothetical protein